MFEVFDYPSVDEAMDGTADRQVEPAPCTQQLRHNVEHEAGVYAPGNTVKSMSKNMASNIEPTLETAARPPSVCSTRRAPMQSEKLRIPTWMAQAHRHWKCMLTASMDEEMDGTDDRQVEPTPCTQQLRHTVEQEAEMHEPGNTKELDDQRTCKSHERPCLVASGDDSVAELNDNHSETEKNSIKPTLKTDAWLLYYSSMMRKPIQSETTTEKSSIKPIMETDAWPLWFCRLELVDRFVKEEKHHFVGQGWSLWVTWACKKWTCMCTVFAAGCSLFSKRHRQNKLQRHHKPSGHASLAKDQQQAH